MIRFKKTFVSSILVITVFVGTQKVAAGKKTGEPIIQSSKPNIIWVITEDICPELGCYGYPLVKTPNVDALAKEGVRYTNAYATGPVCSASRSALITAMYQTSIDAQNHRSHRDDGYKLPEPVKPITDYFRQAGYYTTNGEMGPNGIRGAGKTDYNFELKNKPFDGTDWKNRAPGQPFFAEVMISCTHRGPVWKGAVQQHQPQIDPAKVVLPPYYPDDSIARQDWSTYLEAIQLMDSYLGVLLKRIQEEGIADNTLVIFTSDHGRCHVRDKQFLYDGGLHIPFVIRWPAQLKGGQVNNDLISGIDISATILQVAGIPLPAYIEGRPILGQNVKKRDYIIAARDRMDETVDKMRCVRTKEFKYIKNYMPERPYMQPNNYKETQYPMWNLMKRLYAEGKLTPEQALFCAPTKPAEELYDLKNDPNELNNLAITARYKNTLFKMRSILDNWIKTTGDKGQFPEKKIWLPAKKSDG